MSCLVTKKHFAFSPDPKSRRTDGFKRESKKEKENERENSRPPLAANTSPAFVLRETKQHSATSERLES